MITVFGTIGLANNICSQVNKTKYIEEIGAKNLVIKFSAQKEK